MMNKIKLTLSKNYVKSWGVFDALRELFQNAIDREKESMTYQMIVDYDEDLKRLRIGNKNTTLMPQTLLLGESIKAEGSIGQFGEGYKLAMLVLTRLGHGVIVRSGSQEWSTDFQYDETFQTKLLTLNITNIDERQDLVFEVQGIDLDTWEEYVSLNLNLQEYERISTTLGEVLTEKRHARKLFVGGLYICDLRDNFSYGFNFPPSLITLERDRKGASDFQIEFACSRAIDRLPSADNCIVANLVLHDSPEVRYLSSDRIDGDSLYVSLCEKYGDDIIAYTDVEDLKRLQKKYGYEKNYIKKSQKVIDAIARCNDYSTYLASLPELEDEDQPTYIIRQFMADFPAVFENKTLFVEAFKERILQESENWIRRSYE